MNRNYGESQYSSVYVEDNKDGFFGFELYCASSGETKRVASVIFWDACGQYFVETFGSDVPLDILEALIAETREHYRIQEAQQAGSCDAEEAV